MESKSIFYKIEIGHEDTKALKINAIHLFISCLCVFVATLLRCKAAEKNNSH